MPKKQSRCGGAASLLRLALFTLYIGTAVNGIPMDHKSYQEPRPEHLHVDGKAPIVAKLGADLGGGILTGKPVVLCDDVVQYAGYFNVTTATKMYFYWFFESRSAPKTDPVVLWMTGGPGCSSSMALFNELGPCTVNKDLSTAKNPYSWNSQSSLIFIDQPAGTGFSYGETSDLDTNEEEVSRDMYHFMQAFYKAYPKYLPNPFYVFGESYAGHYVPATAHRVHVGNVNNEGVQIPLHGLGIGNGLTAPEIQYKYYSQFAFKNDIKPLVSRPVFEAMELSSGLCVAQIKACQANKSVCEMAFTFCGMSQVTPVQLTGINLYDIRKPCSNPPLCYDFSSTKTFLRLPAVTDALGTTGHEWSSCNFEVNAMFHKDWMHSFESFLPDLLSAGKRILIYAGDVDYICNYMGNKAWTLDMDWEGKAMYNKEVDHTWTAAGAPAGKARTYNNFTFLQVFKAGHMVPMDKPAEALEMLKTFLSNTPFY